MDAIKTLNEHLEHWKMLYAQKICEKKEGEETIKALECAIETIEQKQWLIDQYEHEVETLEQDLADKSNFSQRVIKGAKLGVYKRVLDDLKGDREDC